jgi:hypothetical protein
VENLNHFKINKGDKTMLKNYKIFAGNMIVESDNTKELKVQLLNFIKSATEPQVKNFILNGTIMENIKEDEVKDFDKTWDINKSHFSK